MLYKKDKHDLKGKLPPANTKLPLVPLTDVELIVFFYNSTIRPIVSVRLYARGGPNWIAKMINEHRVVKPEGYKRNTCSVHCNKAVKTFISMHGEEWKTKTSEYFMTANDEQATDTIRQRGEELTNACDFPVLDLFKDLIKFPGEHQSGIFTHSIRWCRENNVNAMVSQVHLIAEALKKGEDPRDSIDFSTTPTYGGSAMAAGPNSAKKNSPVLSGKGKGAALSTPEVDSDATEYGDDEGEVSSKSSASRSRTPVRELAPKTESPI